MWRSGNAAIIFATFVAALCSIVYELIFAQSLTTIFGGTVTQYSLTIGLFLFSLGVGSLLYEHLIRANHARAFFIIEVLLAAAGFTGVLFIFAVNTLLPAAMPFFITVALSYAPVIVVGVLSGLELPLLAALERRKSFTTVLGVDYFGSLTGTVLWALALYPLLGLVASSFMVASLNLLLALIVLFAYRIFTPTVRFAAAGALVLFVGAVFLAQPHIENTLYERYMAATITRDYAAFDVPVHALEVVNVLRTPYQDATLYDITLAEGGTMVRDRCLNLDEHVQMCDRWVDAYHRGLVDVPLALLSGEDALRVLIIGGGDFIPVAHLREYDERIAHIDLVDIDARFVAYAKEEPYLLAKNERAFEYEKLSTHIDDGYRFMRENRDTYDLILIDLPGAKHDKLLPLYSRELYTYLSRALSPRGIIVGWRYPPERFPEHAAVFETTLYAAGFTRTLEYTALRDTPTGSVEVEQFFVLSRGGEPHIDTAANAYTQRYADTLSQSAWRALKPREGIAAHSTFRANYDMLVHTP